jgi:hypothetical protein
MLKLLFIAGAFTLLCNKISAQTKNGNKKLKASFVAVKEYTYRIIPAVSGTYGYEILHNGKPLIRQLTIPAGQEIKHF